MLATTWARSRSKQLSPHSGNTTIAIYWSIAGAALLYTLLRAVRLSFVHDESESFNQYVLCSLHDTLTYTGYSPSNNHLLNSLLMRASASVFGESELALRLPALLAHVGYLWTGFLLTRRFASALIGVGTFALLVANPFMLDYFSLARGYALSLAFMMLGIEALVRFFESPAKDRAAPIAGFILLALAALAGFTALNAYLAAAVAICIELLANHWFERSANDLPAPSSRGALKTIAAIAIITALLLAIALPVLLKLRRLGELYYGGTSGFFSDTVVSLVRSALYEDPRLAAITPALAVALLTVFAASALFLFRGGTAAPTLEAKNPTGRIAAGMAIAAALGTVAQHQLFGTNFLTDRAALFFLPLAVLAIGAAADEAFSHSPALLGLGAQAAFAVLVCAALANTLVHANLSHTLAWRFDAETKTMIDDLETLAGDPKLLAGQRQKTLGITWTLEPSVNYYIHRRKLTWLASVHRSGVSFQKFDYYFYAPEDAPLLKDQPLRVVARYPLSQSTFAVRVGR